MGSRKGIVPEDILLMMKVQQRTVASSPRIKNRLKSRAAEIFKVYCTTMSPYLLDAP